MRTKWSILFVFLVLATSCVTKKAYEELEFKYDRLVDSNSKLIKNNEDLVRQRNQLKNELKNLNEAITELESKKILLQDEYTATQSRLDELIGAYRALESESSQQLSEKATEIQNLIKELEAKEKALNAKEMHLSELQNALDERTAEINELEALLSQKEVQMSKLRNAVSNALAAYEGKGLSITHKNGKIYVSMENKLLFDSGSWGVGSTGKTAVQKLAAVLKDNRDIEVLIEGHTDNVPYSGGVLLDNWDLSVKRATAIVRILENNGVDPLQIIAAGRSKYLPVADNQTSEGRAKNRRIDIILSPNLDEINNLLNKE